VNTDARTLVSILRVKAEGWAALAEAQSAMAHSCIVSYFVKSAKFEYLFSVQRELTQQLQQKFEVSLDYHTNRQKFIIFLLATSTIFWEGGLCKSFLVGRYLVYDSAAITFHIFFKAEFAFFTY
jgi:hypothetical protein